MGRLRQEEGRKLLRSSSRQNWGFEIYPLDSSLSFGDSLHLPAVPSASPLWSLPFYSRPGLPSVFSLFLPLFRSFLPDFQAARIITKLLINPCPNKGGAGSRGIFMGGGKCSLGGVTKQGAPSVVPPRSPESVGPVPRFSPHARVYGRRTGISELDSYNCQLGVSLRVFQPL